MCTVYDVNNRDATGAAKIVRELAGYEGFLSSCRFLDDSHIITGSGDMKICIWDLEAGKRTSDFNAHCGDVVSISLSPDKNTYVTGSVDKTCKLWDVREDKPKQMFFGHTADVNSVAVSTNYQIYSFTRRLLCSIFIDHCSTIQAVKHLPLHRKTKVPVYSTFVPINKSPATHHRIQIVVSRHAVSIQFIQFDGISNEIEQFFHLIAMSFSGRYVFCGSDDKQIHIWDSLKTTYNCESYQFSYIIANHNNMKST